MERSQYNSTKDLKITYYLGAGASFHALPIWGDQAISMMEVAREVLKKIENRRKGYNKPGNNPSYDFLYPFFKKLEYFGLRAQEYGSIDIYAKKLFLNKDNGKLNELKSCVSVYFDLWESGLLQCSNTESNKYSKIDKRYLSLLSVLLTSSEKGILFNSKVSFISWNYDLQVESAFESFLNQKKSSITDLVSNLNNERNTIIHLNGHRGVLSDNGENFDTVNKGSYSSIDQYLDKLFQRKEQFVYKDDCFIGNINYGWEMDSAKKAEAKEVMAQTDILVIIGYSFPAFNRQIDQELISEFEKNSNYKKVVYQDPKANEDIVKNLFHPSTEVHLEKLNTSQFYIPHEYLAPSEGAFFVI